MSQTCRVANFIYMYNINILLQWKHRGKCFNPCQMVLHPVQADMEALSIC